MEANRFNKESLDILYEMVLNLRTRDECKALFADLCTIPELKAISQRCVVAKMLRDGCNYQEIVEKTGASTATISRVNRSLQYGENGYNTVFDRIDDNK